MQKKNIKRNKGITLIALIITIIVMLILVGVTINVALNGGLFSTAQKAKRRTEKARLNEELNSIIVAMNADILANPEEYDIGLDGDEITLFEIALEKLEENFTVDETVIKTENDGTKDIRYLDFEGMYNKGLVVVDQEAMSYTLTVPCKYKENDVNIIVEINDDTTVAVTKFDLEANIFSVIQTTGETPTLEVGGNIKELTEDGVPIPKGFYYVTGTKNTGVVISDNQADENNGTGNNGNQFVWVPVETNPKLEIKIETRNEIKTVRILNTDGYDETITVNSDRFEKTINPTKNSVYEIIAEYEDGSVEDNLYEIHGFYEKLYRPILDLNGFFALTNVSQEEGLEMLKEGALQENPDAVLNTKIDIIKEFEKAQYGEGTEDSAIETESVLKYGGFYIGRYEVGTDGTIKKGNSPKRNISYETAKSEAEDMYNDNTLYGVKSGMVSGAAWDSVGKWLISSGAKDFYSIYASSTNWGNYEPNGSWQVQGSLRNSGSYEHYSANNIYDLAGNLQEWTTEIEVGKTGNITRGSHYSVRGYPNFYSAYVVTSANDNTGYRPILYFY